MAKNVIGEKLKEMGKTGPWLSQKTGISKSTIARLVNNEAPNPRANFIIVISNALQIPMEELWDLDSPHKA